MVWFRTTKTVGLGLGFGGLGFTGLGVQVLRDYAAVCGGSLGFRVGGLGRVLGVWV